MFFEMKLFLVVSTAMLTFEIGEPLCIRCVMTLFATKMLTVLLLLDELLSKTLFAPFFQLGVFGPLALGLINIVLRECNVLVLCANMLSQMSRTEKNKKMLRVFRIAVSANVLPCSLMIALICASSFKHPNVVLDSFWNILCQLTGVYISDKFFFVCLGELLAKIVFRADVSIH